MEQNLKELFNSAKYSPESRLSDNVWSVIIAKKTKILRIKSYLYMTIGVFSLISLIPITKELINQFTQSGFYEYLSLAFISGGSILLYWKELSLSLVESIPFMNLTFSLLLLFIFFVSVRRMMYQFKSLLLA